MDSQQLKERRERLGLDGPPVILGPGGTYRRAWPSEQWHARKPGESFSPSQCDQAIRACRELREEDERRAKIIAKHDKPSLLVRLGAWLACALLWAPAQFWRARR